MLDPFAGNLLVASSTVAHPIYAGGVCLIVQQDMDHTIGVMLNRPMIPQQTIPRSKKPPQTTSPPTDLETGFTSESSDVSRDRTPQHHHFFGAEPSHSEVSFPPTPLHFGGPISGPVVALHQQSELAEMEMQGGIYVAAERDHLEKLVHQQQSPYRLIVGHLRWDEDALEQEIEAGIWHLLPATAEQVFSPAQGMWPRLIRRATSRSMAHWVKTADAPHAHLLN
ncbi:MAG: YqgE/AlgH family protein [Planctomycetota bacterium]